MALNWLEIDPTAWRAELQTTEPEPHRLWKAVGMIQSEEQAYGFALYVFQTEPDSHYDSYQGIEVGGVQWYLSRNYCGISDLRSPPLSLEEAKEKAWRRLRSMGSASFNLHFPESPE